MTQAELTSFIKAAIFNTPPCPDGSNGLACVSCIAEFVTDRLVDQAHISLSSSSDRFWE